MRDEVVDTPFRRDSIKSIKAVRLCHIFIPHPCF
jgi:hypothetical protein